ncbi:uncharacterized protein BDZ99DRAFT_481259 [Mytilinidion resinicola]|uniref:Uncharacterized protein n=1 Tax=Mytilinidion resinicola TaxID=574789 RepID=A0A6A6Y6J1_9PEZI|nr:uncharacterized protein BDZ99DRAFT_481259 [Mytilinidion resinicola]KAF2804446.1 hypothetical protein BDZ99DRAFT_481259 [Mytilinidion resinicola]
MSQDTAEPNQLQASVPQACIPETSSCPIDIRPSESSTGVQPSSGQALAFSSAPPKQFAVPSSCILSKPSSSFTTWDDSTRCDFISDADLSFNGKKGPILEEAPSPPKPQLPVMPLLKREKVDRSRQAHRILHSRVAKKALPEISENSKEGAK